MIVEGNITVQKTNANDSLDISGGVKANNLVLSTDDVSENMMVLESNHPSEGDISNKGFYSSNFTTGSGFSGYFSGSGYLSLPYNAAINTSTFTVAIWYYVTSWDSHQHITSSLYSSGSRKGYEIYQNITNQQFAFGIEIGTAVNQNDITTPNGLSLNTWYHIVVTYDGTTQKLYHNGSLQSQQAFSNYSPNTSSNTEIGYSNVTQNPFNGYMYDYRYFNRAITASEANLIYSQHKVIGDEVLHLPMSDASNNTGITTNLGSYRISESTITNTGNVSTQVWPGDYVAKFSGSNYLTIDYNSALNTSEFTVSLWLRPSIVNQFMWVIDNTMLEDSVNKGFEMKFEGSNARVYFSILDGNAGYQLISTPVLTANKWYHLVFQYNGTN